MTRWVCACVSISEEEPGPLRSETEGKVQGPKISRTFSYLRSKMSKKGKVRTPATIYCTITNVHRQLLVTCKKSLHCSTSVKSVFVQ